MKILSSRAILAALAVTAFGAIITTAYIYRKKNGETATPRPEAPTRAFGSNRECAQCHRQIYDEWLSDEHAGSTKHLLLNFDPQRTECASCHAPKPVFEIGLDKMAELRDGRYDEGVGCLECHKSGDTVAGTMVNPPRAECNPTFDARLKNAEQCNPCHALHGVYDEWKKTTYATRGAACQECHMPVVERPLPGGGVKRGRSHKFRDGNELKLLQEAVTLAANVTGDSLAVTVANAGAGHHIPAEISNREIILLTIIADAQGKEVKRFKESFKAADRMKRATEKSTQIPHGESRAFSYAPGIDHGTATVQLRYKRQYLIQFADEDSLLIIEKNMTF